MKRIITSLVVAAAFASCTAINPITATNNRIGDKVGKSESVCLFYFGGNSSGIVLNKNYGVQEAAKKGGLTSIATVDLKVTSYFLFSKTEIIVTGE